MNKHSSEFDHFNKYSKSTLMCMTKKELVDHIECLYDNWSISDLALEYACALNEALKNECPNFDINQFSYYYWAKAVGE